MAEVKWQKRAEKELLKYLLQGYQQFGPATANKFAEQVRQINDKLAKHPEIGFPEPLLSERIKLYRGIHVQKRFKLVYHYDPKTDIVHIVDIWDSRREPQNLAKRIKTKNTDNN